MPAKFVVIRNIKTDEVFWSTYRENAILPGELQVLAYCEDKYQAMDTCKKRREEIERKRKTMPNLFPKKKPKEFSPKYSKGDIVIAQIIEGKSVLSEFYLLIFDIDDEKYYCMLINCSGDLPEVLKFNTVGFSIKKFDIVEEDLLPNVASRKVKRSLVSTL